MLRGRERRLGCGWPALVANELMANDVPPSAWVRGIVLSVGSSVPKFLAFACESTRAARQLISASSALSPREDRIATASAIPTSQFPRVFLRKFDSSTLWEISSLSKGGALRDGSASRWKKGTPPLPLSKSCTKPASREHIPSRLW